MLLGCDEGLYLLDLTTASRPPVRVLGVGGVYQMSLLDGTDTIAIITGTLCFPGKTPPPCPPPPPKKKKKKKNILKHCTKKTQKNIVLTIHEKTTR